jgi:exosortase A
MNKTLALLPSAQALRRMAPGLLLVLALLLLFRQTAAAMVSIWNRSDTFAHAFLVPPLVVWLIWRRRARLATLPLQPSWWAILPMALVSLLWLLGALAGVNAGTQFALVALIVLSVPAVFGFAVARVLLFPLMFLFFAVPFGEFLVPSMMVWTADFTVAAMQLSGVPVYREGLQFMIPSGSWSVVEACSGVRYLIASFMVGTLFAYLNFKTLHRRLLFIAVSLLVPIIANWVRAYMIVMIGHLSGNKLAVGVDHLVYGWAFFGLVIGLMFWIGSHFAEHGEDTAAVPPATDGTAAALAPAPTATMSLAPWAVGFAALVLWLLAQWGYAQLNRQTDASSVTPQLTLAERYGPWAASAQPITNWTPGFQHARTVASGSYGDGVRQAGVWVGYYRDQGYDKKLISSTNLLTSRELDARWASSDKGAREVSVPGLATKMAVAEVRASLSMSGTTFSDTGQRLRVWHVYWIGGHWVVGQTQGRLWLALNRLLGKSDDAAVLIFYAPVAPTAESAQADTSLQAWVAEVLPALADQLRANQVRR